MTRGRSLLRMVRATHRTVAGLSVALVALPHVRRLRDSFTGGEHVTHTDIKSLQEEQKRVGALLADRLERVETAVRALVLDHEAFEDRERQE